MLITEKGQLATPSGAAELRDQYLRDIALAAIDAGIETPPVQPGSDWYIGGTGLANELLIVYANQSIGLAAHNVLTATGADLDAIRIGLGLPQVADSGSSGKIVIRVFGATTLVDGTQFILPNGLRGKVVGTYTNPSDYAEVNAQAIDVGEKTNLAAGQVVRFVSPPSNIGTDARVSDGEPLTGGTDSESDERKRARILNTLRNKPAGGNWAHIREIVLEGLGSVQDCYVYPAIGGPGSAKVVPVRQFDRARNSFTRELSTAALATVRGLVQSNLPTPMEIVVQAAADQDTDFTLSVTIPESSQNGGNGLGWTDAAPWPPLVVADAGKVTVSSANSTYDQITVTANTTTTPLAGLTHVSWWSPVDLKFYTALITAKSGSSSTWALTLDRALVASDGTPVATGDYISPAAFNLEKYGISWVALFESLGPGENTADSNRLPRALRHPFATTEDPHSLNAGTIASWSKQFPEISDYEVSYSSATSPTVPATIDLPPNVLVPRHFGVYQQ